jgi:hypothetical protein
MLNLATGRVDWEVRGIWTGASGAAVFTSDGRFVVYQTQDPAPPGLSRTEVRDAATGGLVAQVADFMPFVAHPRQLAVYGFRPGGGVARLDLNGVTTLVASCGLYGEQPMDITPDGSRLLVRCGATELVTLDTVSNAVLSRATLPDYRPQGLAANADGTLAAWVTFEGPESSAQPVIQLLDTTSGQVVKSRAISTTCPGCFHSTRLQPTPMRDRFALFDETFFLSTVPFCQIVPLQRTAMVISAETLETIAPLTAAQSVEFSFANPDGTVAYLAGDPCRRAALASALDLTTGAPVVGVTPWGWLQVFTMAMAFPPVAPVLSGTAAAGGTVQLHWNLPPHSPAATDYELEVGSAPDAVDLGAFTLEGGTAISFSGVPSGSYFVRLRARNVTGMSPASNELRLDVP